MLTKLSITNFKRFDAVEIELGSPVVFVGPNNSGKTTALQALSLWYLGLQRLSVWRIPSQAVLNRQDLFASLVPDCAMLWRNQDWVHVPLSITVAGITANREWESELTFLLENDESLTCQAATVAGIPSEAAATRVAFLPPLSGLTDREFVKQAGEIDFLIGQGRTGELLRNLCFHVRSRPDGEQQWAAITQSIERLFGVRLDEPRLVNARSELTMGYTGRSERGLDISCSGRGMQQFLLLVAYLTLNPGSVLLLDEPDAHLEILLQRQVYRELARLAGETNSQIVLATHSEVLLNEAADRDVVVSFVGKPHRIDDRGTQTLKALKEIGFEQYYEAEQRGWVLYLEGSTDLSILQEFARTLNHPAQQDLDSPFVRYVENQPQKARDHFHGLREAKSDLLGILICDRLDRSLQSTAVLDERMWRRREIENYLCQPETLMAFAESNREAMQESISLLVPPVALRDSNDEWWRDTKATDAFLDRLFASFYSRLDLPNLMRKSNYHRLAAFVPLESIDPEIAEVLDAIHRQALLAKPVT